MLLLVEGKEAWEQADRKRKIRLRPQAAAAAGDSSVLLNFIYKPLLTAWELSAYVKGLRNRLKHNSDCWKYAHSSAHGSASA